MVTESKKLGKNVIIKSKPDALIVRLLLGTSVVRTKPNCQLVLKIDVEIAKKEAANNVTMETLLDASIVKLHLDMSAPDNLHRNLHVLKNVETVLS